MVEAAKDCVEVADLTIITRPNCSLSAAGRLLFFCVMLLFSAVIAGGFALLGAWLILPFAGLEVLALGLAIYYIGCHANDYERIVISGSSMIVEVRNHKIVHRTEFQRYWVQTVVLPASGHGKCRVWVRERGREMELGRFADDEGRMALARQIREQTGSGYRV